MKKIIIYLLVLMLFCFTGCASNDLEDRIIALEQTLAELELENTNLLNDVMALQGENQSLISQTAALGRSINDLIDDVASIDEREPIKIHLAKEYYLTPGDTFQLFYRSIIQAVNPYGYYIRLVGSVGNMYNRYYEWSPSTSDLNKSYSLTVEIRDDNGNLYQTATTQLKVAKSTTTQTRNILCVGDSLTANGYWVSYGYQKYVQAGGVPITFLGTINTGYQATINHEGRGGWQWSSFVSGYGSTLSPFQDANGRFSFADYCTRNGYSTIDELYVLLTWNGIGGTFRQFSMYTEPMYSAKVFIDKFHSEFPDAKVTLLGIPQPSVNAGLGAYYTINQSYGNNYGQFVTALNYNTQLEEWANTAAYKDFMRFVDVKAQFDSEYNMPTVAKPVNNQSTVTEPVGSAMGMHPSTAGYLQIGDAFYRALSHNW